MHYILLDIIFNFKVIYTVIIMNYVNKLLKSLGEDIKLCRTELNSNQLFESGIKRWIGNIIPVELLNKNVKQTIELIVSLCECYSFYEYFPDEIESPNYGDNWGVRANYIEINNRAIAEMSGNRTKNGLLSTIKLLPAIPPSAKSWANCIILSQIFPNIFGDGYNKPKSEENSIYGLKLNTNYSDNIINNEIKSKISPEEQFRAFNDLAHFRGLKTGFRTIISADQIKVVQADGSDITFNWDNSEHVELFINEHAKLVKLGFEAVFIDSAKHIGGYDMENYTGVGALPSYGQMQYILHEIRSRSGCTSVSFVGEKSTDDFNRYKTLGLTSGTGFLYPDNYDEVKMWSIKFKYEHDYSPAIEVSDDNNMGGHSYETRLNRINNSLFAYEYPSDKLPSFMQMEDIFPIRYDTSTHELMMMNVSYSLDGTKESHWENLFAKDDGREYNRKVGELFYYALNL